MTFFKRGEYVLRHNLAVVLATGTYVGTIHYGRNSSE